jgi:hypothetical protein
MNHNISDKINKFFEGDFSDAGLNFLIKIESLKVEANTCRTEETLKIDSRVGY